MKTFTKFFKLITIVAVIAVSFNACALLVGSESTVSKVSKENYDKIEVKMTTEELIQILGEPRQISDMKTPAGVKKQLWFYNFSEVKGSSRKLHTITIDIIDGKVDDKSLSTTNR